MSDDETVSTFAKVTATVIIAIIAILILSAVVGIVVGAVAFLFRWFLVIVVAVIAFWAGRVTAPRP